jgi:DNA-binding NarL/FixJ family response regulator
MRPYDAQFDEWNEAPPTIRVVVADDHPVVRAGVVHALARHPDMSLLGEASNGRMAVEMVQTLEPDVLVLDINMPGMTAADVVRQTRSQERRTRVLVLTTHDDIDNIRAMLKAGAGGYLLKDEDSSAISRAVRTVARGDTWISASVTANVVNYTLHEPEETPESLLSERELDVLRQLAAGKDNQEIGDVLSISERTVRFHLRNIYDKLGMRRGEAIAWSVQRGLAPAPVVEVRG